MQRSLPIFYLTVIFIVGLITHSEGKRGCALYGHSCYGGHGKRSDVVPMAAAAADNGYSAMNKENYIPLNYMNGVNQVDLNNDNRWKSRTEMNIALYTLLQRWIDDAKKASEEVQQAPEGDTVFKNTFA